MRWRERLSVVGPMLFVMAVVLIVHYGVMAYATAACRAAGGDMRRDSVGLCWVQHRCYDGHDRPVPF